MIGVGGCEYVISKKFLDSLKVDIVYCVLGNFGMVKDGINCVVISD